jgi:hypothetical protein
MPYELRQWPRTVYPDEVADLFDAQADIDVALSELRTQGPRPEGYQFKPLGAVKGGLWQLNFKSSGKQIRFLYAPYGNTIVIFRIHKKSSPQEQQRAYTQAMKRKRQAELIISSAGMSHVHNLTVH